MSDVPALGRGSGISKSPHGLLWVGSVVVGEIEETLLYPEVVAIFRDDMLRIDHVPGTEREVVEFRAPGPVIAARLEIMGIDKASVLARMDDQLINRERLLEHEYYMAFYSDPARIKIEHANVLRKSLGGRGWLDCLASAPEEPQPGYEIGPHSRGWLLQELASWDILSALRVVLLAFPDAEVVLDITAFALHSCGLATDTMESVRYLDLPAFKSLASNAHSFLDDMAGKYSPVVVLTEGQTDAEFLKSGLAILYPYLTDAIRFLDYEVKPEGGVGALVKLIRALDAAGIANRIVAVFDNDTAAADALRGIGSDKLSPRIRIIQYPAIELAKNYPTIGPPTAESQESPVSLADVNGLAGSIELYLGKDVLTQRDGTLYPVQWKSFIPAMRRYQGEVINKTDIHKRFRGKCDRAFENAERVREQDWDGLRLILDAIRAAIPPIAIELLEVL